METTLQAKTESEIKTDEISEQQSILTNWEGIFSFLIPLIGLILYLSYIHKDRHYQLAKRAGNIALLGLITYVLLLVIKLV